MLKKKEKIRYVDGIKGILKKINTKVLRKTIYDILLVALIPIISIVYEEVSENRRLLNDINSIAIGESGEHFKDCFGVPYFQKKHEESGIDEHVYNNQYAIIRAYFKNNRLIGFFVTEKEEKGKVGLPYQFRKFCDNKMLGRFSFSDISNSPHEVYSYASNGSGYVYYGEEYYYNSAGNYYDFYFSYMEYGFSKMDYDREAFAADNELKKTEVKCNTIAPQINRNTSYPNTYGIIAEEREIIKVLSMDYTEFNFRVIKYE